MDHKLILIGGMSGTGKSTIAQKVARQFQLNGVPHTWLHEEVKNHPIRDGEFKKGSLYTLQGMDANVEDMYTRWVDFAEVISVSGDKSYIVEGCFFQSIIRCFLDSVYTTDQIIKYFDKVSNIIRSLDPLLVFLYRRDIKANFESVYDLRGEWWKQLILIPQEKGYFEHHPYVGDESIYAMWSEYQELSQAIFDRFGSAKLKIDTANCMWDDYIRRVVETVGLKYVPPPVSILDNPSRYCGSFVDKQGGENYALEIRYDEERAALYCVGFWSYMELNPIGVDVFEMASFPIEITYEFIGDRKAIHITGTYDWDIVGRTLEECCEDT